MSKRKAREVPLATYDISLLNEVFIPDLKIKYGSYTLKENDKESEEINEGIENELSEVESLTAFDEVRNDNNGYDSDIHVEFDMDYIGDNEQLPDEDEMYEQIDVVEENVFDDSILFKKGFQISKKKGNTEIDDETNVLLFEGSNFTLKQFCRYMKILKSNQNLGDVAFSIIVGSILSFLPERNAFVKYIDKNPTLYDIISKIDKLSNIKKCCRIFKFKLCDEEKCVLPFNSTHDIVNVCSHSKKKKKSFHYLPIRDRIKALLETDIRHFFHTLEYATKPNVEVLKNIIIISLINI